MQPDDRRAELWIAVGVPGFSGDSKASRAALLDERFGADGWRWAWYVRGALVGFAEAIAEYEQSYRVHLQRNPSMVEWLVSECGNVYDHHVENTFDDDYRQLGPTANHYQDIAVRRVIAELTDATSTETKSSGTELAAIESATTALAADSAGGRQLEPMTDLTTGETHRVPRARGFRGQALAQIRDARSPAYFLSPALVPVHDPLLISTLPTRTEWYHLEGCSHLSVEAFWQMSKLIEARFDRFAALGDRRDDPLEGI